MTNTGLSGLAPGGSPTSGSSAVRGHAAHRLARRAGRPAGRTTSWPRRRPAAPRRAASSSRLGTATSTVTSRSPVRAVLAVHPAPAHPERAPARGARAGSAATPCESSVGTVSVVPSASSGIRHRHGQGEVVGVALRPPEQPVRADVHLDVQVARGRAAAARLTLAGSRICCPSATPAGSGRSASGSRVLTPSPPHSGHGSSMIRPVPRQSRHGSENANAPWLRLTRPTPSQVGHVRGRAARPGAGAAAALAAARRRQPQRHLGAARRRRRSRAGARSRRRAPRCARLAADGRPAAPPGCRTGRRTGRRARPHRRRRRRRRRTGRPRSKLCPPAPAPKPPGKPPPPEAAATAREQRPRLVVLPALLVVGEHPVGLGHRLEPGLGRGVARVGVRVQLAGELAVRLLDLVRGRAGGDAQLAVEVLLDPVALGHSASSPLVSEVPVRTVPGRRLRGASGVMRRPRRPVGDGDHRRPQHPVGDAGSRAAAPRTAR